MAATRNKIPVGHVDYLPEAQAKLDMLPIP